MGLKCSPDYAQEVMENIFCDVANAEEYIDDISAFSNSWEDHVSLISKILTLLQDNGFTVNPLKCEWAVKETDWLEILGYSNMFKTMEKENWSCTQNAVSIQPETTTWFL